MISFNHQSLPKGWLRAYLVPRAGGQGMNVWVTTLMLPFSEVVHFLEVPCLRGDVDGEPEG